MSWLVFALCGPILWAISTHLDKYLVERYFKGADVMVLSVSIGSGPRRERFRWKLAALMLCAGFILSLSTLIFKAFAVKDEFWATTFWMFAGEALYGLAILGIGHYRRQFFDLLRSNGGALIAINASNELINLGGGLAN